MDLGGYYPANPGSLRLMKLRRVWLARRLEYLDQLIGKKELKEQEESVKRGNIMINKGV